MKNLLFFLGVVSISLLTSCKSTIITQHVTTEQLNAVEPGMDKQQALAAFAGIFPYDIMMGTDAGCEVHVYKYWKPSRSLLRANLQLEAYLNSGKKIYVKEADAYIYYQDGKVVLVATEGNKGKFFNIIDVHKQDEKACQGPVKGCTDPASLTYNPDATEDDGSCTYCDCGSISNPNYDAKRPISDCNQPCLKLEDPNAQLGNNQDDCSLCDLIKSGEKINLNINMNSSDMGSSKNSRTNSGGKEVANPLKSRKSKKGEKEASGDNTKSKVGFQKPFSK